jgi:ABC-type transport system involved in multi-copper enzyme maturation permease subunit
MTWRVITRRDVAETVRPRLVKLLLALPALVILGGAYLYPVLGSEPYTTARFAGFISGWLPTVVALAGILLGYNAVVGKRESGAIRLALSLPNSRLDVAFGAFASRAGLLCGVIAGSLAAGFVLVVYPFGSVAVVRFLGFAVATVTLGALWVGLGLATSLVVATKRTAFILAFGLFGLFRLAWGPLSRALEVGLAESGLTGEEPVAAAALRAVEPGRVFERVVDAFVDPSASVDNVWYLNEWLALCLFVVWLVVPLGLATSRFIGSDLS